MDIGHAVNDWYEEMEASKEGTVVLSETFNDVCLLLRDNDESLQKLQITGPLKTSYLNLNRARSAKRVKHTHTTLPYNVNRGALISVARLKAQAGA
jgi:hypothetical protein